MVIILIDYRNDDDDDRVASAARWLCWINDGKINKKMIYDPEKKYKKKKMGLKVPDQDDCLLSSSSRRHNNILVVVSPSAVPTAYRRHTDILY